VLVVQLVVLVGLVLLVVITKPWPRGASPLENLCNSSSSPS